jgi:hypothetical protein
MDQLPPSTAPHAGTVLKFIGTCIWGFKWLIGAGMIAVVVTAIALFQLNSMQVWTGKTALTIGLAPSISHILQNSGSPLSPLEKSRDVIAHISDPLFKQKVVSQAAFEPATAAFSRDMAFSSLRAVELNGEREVMAEVSAGSAADVQALLVALAAEIGREHEKILDQRREALQARIDDAKGRIAQIEALNVSQPLPSIISDARNWMRLAPLQPPPFIGPLPVWNELKDRVQHDTSLMKLMVPTAVSTAPGSYLLTHRSVGMLASSILAGVTMLAAMIVLTIVLSSPSRPPRSSISL